MTSRRTVLRAGMALPIAALPGAPLFSRVACAAGKTLALERFIFDPRFAEAFDVGEAIGRLGVPLSPVADDLMSLWYDELDLLWKDEPRPLAGVTLAEALFALETLAADRSMRVVFRGDHGLVEDGRIRHRLTGPLELTGRFGGREARSAWKAELAEALASCPLGRPTAGTVEFVTEAPALSLRDRPLVSWIIAPRRAVAVTLPG